jgi:hypothetical protein
LTISRYLKLTSLQENENGFKGLTAERRHFECLCSDDNAVFLVSDKEILRIILDKEFVNWIDYKEIAKQQGLTLDDSDVTIQLQEKPEATPKAAALKVEAKTTKTTQTKASQTKAPTKKATSATKK